MQFAKSLALASILALGAEAINLDQSYTRAITLAQVQDEYVDDNCCKMYQHYNYGGY